VPSSVKVWTRRNDPPDEFIVSLTDPKIDDPFLVDVTATEVWTTQTWVLEIDTPAEQDVWVMVQNTKEGVVSPWSHAAPGVTVVPEPGVALQMLAGLAFFTLAKWLRT